jgi:hypothetical protein
LKKLKTAQLLPTAINDSTKNSTVVNMDIENIPEEPKKTNRGAKPTYGLTILKQTINKLGGRVIDKRTTLRKTLAKWRNDLITDLGGPDNISTQQSAIIDLVVKSKLMLDSVDVYILTLPTAGKSQTEKPNPGG